MKKIAEVLVVEDFTGKGSPRERLQEVLSELKDVDAINVVTVHIPEWNEELDLTGVHVIVREVAET
ncbi:MULTISPECIES: hypothetical protein [Metallosphaera]|uniref:Uncharacterized protein n=3 Tax=Metallosphaera TaxID=41980 RepID=A4YHG7_METS5|nr:MULTISPECIES: hypothetical protein [Metallosphaera]ABP95869.1 hypothetical protein Msed_1714 [Metallosphaera sedula DSM 5348]AIM27853.1 hypothetical protein HA72_1714 [Metallosphaera sedula]AKV74698.1 hypothetical protein MsedA_1748 [Metallosphaera sedula]AKV76936.1 hypothetical protein MsedB_1750 [Metallosphaera sedula]AKV79187.1 hypothetical protein MsedC_1748 [Metallosphaera sedula]